MIEIPKSYKQKICDVTVTKSKMSVIITGHENQCVVAGKMLKNSVHVSLGPKIQQGDLEPITLR